MLIYNWLAVYKSIMALLIVFNLHFDTFSNYPVIPFSTDLAVFCNSGSKFRIYSSRSSTLLNTLQEFHEWKNFIGNKISISSGIKVFSLNFLLIYFLVKNGSICCIIISKVCYFYPKVIRNFPWSIFPSVFSSLKMEAFKPVEKYHLFPLMSCIKQFSKKLRYRLL